MINIIRHTLIALQIFAVLLPTFDRALVWSGFLINQSYIATTLCENRDKPVFNCKGNCQLRKAFEKLDKQKKEQHLPKEAKTEVLICETLSPISLQVKPLILPACHHPANDQSALANFQLDILKPPMFSA